MNVLRPFHWFIVTGLLLTSRVNCQTPDDRANSGAYLHTNPSSSNLRSVDALFGAILASDANNDNGQQHENRTVVNVRKRRYVRFPSGPNGYVETAGGPPVGPLNRNNLPVRYNPQASGGYYSPWRQQKSYWRSAAPSAVGEFPQRPSAVMGHRTPRLIFRDNDFPPSNPLPPSNFFQSNNHLSEFDDEFRGKLLTYILIFFFLTICNKQYCGESFMNRFDYLNITSLFNFLIKCLSIKFITLPRLSSLNLRSVALFQIKHFSLCTKKKHTHTRSFITQAAIHKERLYNIMYV